MGFFYRHNIHPYTECLRRQETLAAYAESIDFKVIYQDGYDLEGFLQRAVFRESSRCEICYHDRLTAAARVAGKGKFDAFSSSLLYSRFQNHEMIRDIGESVGKTVGIPFHYRDFRSGWKIRHRNFQTPWPLSAAVLRMHLQRKTALLFSP